MVFNSSSEKPLQHPLLWLLNPQSRAELLREHTLRQVNRGRPLFRSGDESNVVHLVCSGTIGVFLREGQRKVLVQILQSPAIYGDAEMFSRSRHPLWAVALQEVWSIQVPASDYALALQHSRRAFEWTSAALARRNEVALRARASLSMSGLEPQVARLLLDYALVHQEEVGGGLGLPPNVTQVSVARDLGFSRRSIARAMDRLRKTGAVAFEERQYRIVDLPAIEQLAQGVASLIVPASEVESSAAEGGGDVLSATQLVPAGSTRGPLREPA